MGEKEERQEAEESGGGYGATWFSHQRGREGVSPRPTSHESGTERTEPFTQLLRSVKPKPGSGTATSQPALINHRL